MNRSKQKYIPQVKFKDLVFNLSFQLFDSIDTCVNIIKSNIREGK